MSCSKKIINNGCVTLIICPQMYAYAVRLPRHVYGPLTRYAKLRVAHAPGMPGTFSPPEQVRDPDMHHGTWVTHGSWCMPGSLTSGSVEVGGGENVRGIPVACATYNFMYLAGGPRIYCPRSEDKQSMPNTHVYCPKLQRWFSSTSAEVRQNNIAHLL